MWQSIEAQGCVVAVMLKLFIEKIIYALVVHL